MRHLKIIILVFTAAAVLSSCKKKKDEEPPAQTFPSYSALKAGNYWIYQHFDVDTLGNATARNVFDSSYVEKDTVINGNTYYKLFKPGIFIQPVQYLYLRDSLHYIVTSTGGIIFSSQDFSTVFFDYYQVLDNGTTTDTVQYMVEKMEDKDVSVTTPAGTFITSDYRRACYMYPNYTAGPNPRNIHHRYAKDVGLVIETAPFYAANPNFVERRLVRYHLN